MTDAHASLPSGRDHTSNRLIEDWQRDLPLVPRPFAEMARTLGIAEGEVISRLKALLEAGIVARVGGVVRPNTLGASTLIAMSVPDLQIGEAAAVLTAEPGVNHIYLRENDWNLWSVVTGPSRAYVEETLARIAHDTGRQVLDLRLDEAFHIDLGFALEREAAPRLGCGCGSATSGVAYSPEPGDTDLVQALTRGMPLVERPFLALAQAIGRDEQQVLARLETLTATGILPRIGVIVRHRALGWRSNAMVVWDVPPADVGDAGRALASVNGINLCYRRTRYADVWPYNLYCMVHARTRDEALDILRRATAVAGLDGYPRQILFSLRCFKQTGAMVALPREAA